MPISFETYERVALEDPDGQWELDCGRLRQKPPMTLEHDTSSALLSMQCAQQLDARAFLVLMNAPRLRIHTGAYYLPDLCVVPVALARSVRMVRPRQLGVLDEPIPLVVEVWSPSTGDYDLNTKIPAYQRRGDAEIWLLHPYELWLRAWCRQADDSYTETRHWGDAVVAPASLHGVQIALAALFE
ncbi:MAG TPA: Uma2 family endonuclease [Dehalococcoidia bacterium]|nr:Uma2 family endonuclease [Dehalococcoidia bacterium]